MNRNQLIEENMNLVYFLIHKYFPTYGFNDDVIQEGMLGLTEAADRWDVERGKFSAYASKYIMGYILRYLRKLNKHNGVLSLDTFYIDGEFNNKITLEEVTPDHSIEFDFEQLFDDDFINTLEPVDQTIITMCRDGYTQDEIGDATNYHIRTVGQRKSKIKRKWVKYNGRN